MNVYLSNPIVTQAIDFQKRKRVCALSVVGRTERGPDLSTTYMGQLNRISFPRTHLSFPS